MSLSKTTQQITFEDLTKGLEFEYNEDTEYTTISGKEYRDVSEYSPFKAYDIDPGEIIYGYPEITIFKNEEKKYDSLRLRVIIDADEEYVDCYANIPKPDKNGYIKNIRKSFDFYRTCFDFLYSVLKYRDERNVIDKNGEEKNKFKSVNIENFAKYVDQYPRVAVRITEGAEDSVYNSWEIIKME